ncbi:MAG: hypothetical protein Kow00117_10670 [Phototrophicales bacterium]
MTTIINLENGAKAEIDEENNIIIGTYGEILTADMTAQVYITGLRFVQKIGAENLRGIIFDFRQVKRFSRDNLPAAQSESYRANRNDTLEHIPVAMIVETPVQEQMVRISMQSTPGKHRKRIVRSREEGYAFITEWHNKTTAEIAKLEEEDNHN